jgi:type II secretory pathway component GspD/PulD (secretin)
LVLWTGTAPQPATAAPAPLSVALRPAPPGAQLTISAPIAFRFALRQLRSPDRLVVDLTGLDNPTLGGDQAVEIPPVRAIRLSRGSGFVQVVVDLTQPVFADVTLAADSRSLTLRLHPVGVSPGAPVAGPVLPTEVVRLQHVRPREVAAHLQTLLPGLTARPDEAAGSVLLTGPPDLLAQAKQLVAALDAPPASAPVTEVLPLQAGRADAMAPLLAAIFPQAQVRAETRANALVVVAPPTLQARIKAVVNALDVPPSAPAAPTSEVLQLRHADPAHVAALLAGTLPQVQIRIDAATRTLTITAPPPVLAQAKALLQQVDAPSPADQVSEIVRVRSDPEALARALGQAVPAITVTPDRAINALVLRGPRAEVERAKAMVSSLESQPVTPTGQMRVEVIVLRHAMPSEFVTEPATSRSAEELAQALQNALQPIYPEVRVTVEKRLQALLVTGTPAAIAAARDLVAQLDQPSRQVALEVRVIEVAANALQNLGISLSPIVGSTITEQDPNNRPFVFGRTPLNLNVVLNLLVERGQGKILASPTVATIDGRKALIRTGDDIPLVTRQVFGNTVIENVITFRAGVTLEIIPKISADSLITTVLRPVVSTITGTTPQGAPQISTREVQTTLTVRDGETIVIGGLLEERDIVSMSRIPGLSNLPFLGRLFRSERREQRRTELVITVTPRLLSLPSTEPPAPPPSRQEP